MHSILVIEDDEVQLRLERILLQEQGYTVYSTADGPQGITIFKQNPIDLVLLDLGLPTMSGIEVLKELRRHNANARIIVVTGYPSVESIVIAMQSGAWDYVQKPVDVNLLLKKIASALAVAGGQ